MGDRVKETDDISEYRLFVSIQTFNNPSTEEAETVISL